MHQGPKLKGGNRYKPWETFPHGMTHDFMKSPLKKKIQSCIYAFNSTQSINTRNVKTEDVKTIPFFSLVLTFKYILKSKTCYFILSLTLLTQHKAATQARDIFVLLLAKEKTKSEGHRAM